MKLTFILVLLFTLPISAALYSQHVKFDIHAKNATIENIFEQIRQQSDFTFVYNVNDLKNVGSITLDCKAWSVEEVLSLCLKESGIAFICRENVIVLKKASQPIAQQGYILLAGAVRDAKGTPLPGVTVVIKGTTTGTATDEKGVFKLNVMPNSTLILSFIGMKTKEVVLTGQKELVVMMEEDIAEIEEVIVTGLFTRPKESYTGAARTFTKEDISRSSSNNLLTALKSLDPSIQIPQDNNLGSNPNALPDITLRGGNSLIDPESAKAAFNYNSSANIPLFILDGFEVSLQRINDLDLNRVLSVVTLKDATATTIYGSRAANGVIVIETIPPAQGKLRMSYTGNAVFEFPDLKGYDLLNAAEKHELDLITGGKYGVWSSWAGYYTEAQQLIFRFQNEQIAKGVDFDWLRLPLRNAVGHKHSLYIEGGDQSITYAVSGSYDLRNGVMKGSGRQTGNISSILQYRIKNLLFKNELSFGWNKAENSPYGRFSEYVRMNPYWAPRAEAGEVPYYVEYIVGWDGVVHSQITNPFYNASLNIKDESKYQLFTENFYTQWMMTDWFKVTGRLTYSKQSDESDYFLPGEHTSFAGIAAAESYKKGSYTKGYGARNSLEGTFTADINRVWDRNIVYVSAGMTFQDISYNTEFWKVEGFPNDRADQVLMGNRYPENGKPSGSESVSRLAGYFANATYNYDGRYLLDASFRYDGSSLYGRDKRFASFYSFGAGWNLHNEKWLKHVEVVNKLKLKYTYGYTGSQNFESYLGITTGKYNTGQDYRYNYGTYIMGYGNEALQWQRTLKKNLGVELELFKRLGVLFNYFNEISEGSIATVSLAPSTGFLSYKENMGDVTHKGWELYTSFNIFSKPGARESWTIFFNAFHVEGTIKKVSNMLEQMNKKNSEELSYLPLPRYVEGMSTTAIWAVQSLGIDPGKGLEIYRKLDGTTTNTYSTIDQVVVGDTRPTMEGTFGTNFEYKGIGLNLFVRYRFGGQVYNQTLVNRVEEADLLYNVDRRVLEKSWKKPGDRAFFKGATYYGMNTLGGGYYTNTNKTYATSRFVEDDNLLSVESLSLYYRFGDRFNNHLGIGNSKVSFYMSDLLWLSSVKRERGLDYPFSRSFTLQLQFTL